MDSATDGKAAAGAGGAMTAGATVGCGCCWVTAGCPNVFAVAAEPSCGPQGGRQVQALDPHPGDDEGWRFRMRRSVYMKQHGRASA